MNHYSISLPLETTAFDAPGFLTKVAKGLFAGRSVRHLSILSFAVGSLWLLGARSAQAQTVINYPNGFIESSSQLWLENAAKLSGSSVQLSTIGQSSSSNNVWFKTPVDIQAFSTTFTWVAKCPASPALCGDGMGFMIISDPNSTHSGYTYSGGSGGQLSWSRCTGTQQKQCPAMNSILVKFDLYNDQTSAEANLTGFYSGGDYPQAPLNPQYDMSSSGIKMQSGHRMRATLTYNGTVLSEEVTDTATGATYAKSYTANIPSLVAGNAAYVGFGAGTGAATVTQELQSWTYSVESTGKAAPPTFSPSGGTYTGSQSVSLKSASEGAVICYNTNATPSLNSSNGCSSGKLYTGPITVAASETLQAVAGGSGYTNGSVSSAAYVIKASSSPSETQAAAPTFSPAGGTFSSSQAVKLSSTSTGTVICYSTAVTPAVSGTNSCSAGSLYTGPVTVSSSESLHAIAGGSGYSESSETTANYVMASGSTPTGTVINFPNGFAGSSGQIWLENFASLSGSEIHLVPSVVHNASNAWFKTPENIQAFTTTFTFRVDCSTQPSDCGDGLGFMIICACEGGNPTYNPSTGHPGYTYSGDSSGQFSWSQCMIPLTPASEYCFNNGSNGNTGSDLKQLPDTILVKFDLYNNVTNQPGANLTGYYTGAGGVPQAPYNPQYDMSPSGIKIQSGHLMSATLSYNGTTLSQTVTDKVTGATYKNSYAANIPAAITGNTGFIGFGGGTGAAVDDVYIDSWTYTVE